MPCVIFWYCKSNYTLEEKKFSNQLAPLANSIFHSMRELINLDYTRWKKIIAQNFAKILRRENYYPRYLWLENNIRIRGGSKNENAFILKIRDSNMCVPLLSALLLPTAFTCKRTYERKVVWQTGVQCLRKKISKIGGIFSIRCNRLSYLIKNFRSQPECRPTLLWIDSWNAASIVYFNILYLQLWPSQNTKADSCHHPL